ncbi:MAG: HAMP domain-containing protein [Syntrophaceae bacterium]|nr:HAMP domain-containing protein [Syntrophaceae bacterium]
MKLKWKLLVLFGVASLAITATLGVLLYQHLREDRFRSIRLNTQEQLRHIAFSVGAFFDEVENDVRTLAQNGIVCTKDEGDFTNFTKADERTFQYRIGPSEQKIIDIFNAYRVTHPYVNSVYMGRANGSFVRSHKRERPTRFDPRRRPWYRHAERSPDGVVITEPYPSITTKDVNIGIVKALVDSVDHVYGVVGADVTLANLTDYILNFKVGPESRILLVDRKGIVLASQNRDLLFSKIGDYSKELGQILLSDSRGEDAVAIEGVRLYVFSREMAGIGWKVAVLIPVDAIEREIRVPILLTTAGLILGLLFLSALSLLGLNAFVIRPLNHLNEETTRIARTSDLNRQVRITSKDEIGMLGTSFNEMITALNVTQKALQDTERNLIRHQEHLEELVKERTEELAGARDKAQDADRLKSAFLASMSHELRTPLNSIIGFTGILLQGLAGPVNEEQAKQLSMVRNSSNHLLQLINEVLDISKIEAGELKLSPEWFDLGEAVDSVAKLVRPLADKKGLPIRVDPVPADANRLFHDRRRVEQVLINLVNNAVKFTENGEIHVRCERRSDEVVVSVRDTGIGIKPEDMGSLFETFRQIETGLTRRYEGTGLGLSISRRLVELMGGRIRAESEGPGRGSVFTFTLPWKKEENDETKDSYH